MVTIRKIFKFIGVLILCLPFCWGQGNVVRPKFPPVFQTEVKGVFKDAKKEMEGTLYYDSMNRKGAFHFMYQGVTTRSIYRFDDNELLHISGVDCSVSNIKTDSVNKFFPFFVDRNGKTAIADPEKLFLFENSTFVREESDFPSYVYKAKLNSPLYNGSNCEVFHTFTKPEMKIPECDKDICQPTLAAMSIKCVNNDGSLKSETTYDFYRFKSDIIDTNVFLPPPDVFCNVSSKNLFPGLPDYFSFAYDLIDGTDNNPDGFAVHKKVWYDSKTNILRVDEFDTEGTPIISRIFDIKRGLGYTSKASLSTCETGIIPNEVVSLTGIAKLPRVFFQGENALSKAVWVGTRRIQGQNFEEWSLLSDNKQTSTKAVQNFYFTKSASKQGKTETMKLSHAEIYTYQMNKEKSESEPKYTYLPVNNFIDRLRWEAFDVASCFTNEQKKKFRLKVDGPPTVKDSKIFQDILNQLYINLIQETNISAVRLSNLACAFDGVRIVGFTGLMLDKPKIIISDAGKNELDMNEAYRMIDYLSKAGKLSLRRSKDGQIVNYKITSIEDIKEENEEDKNLYSGAFVAGICIGFLAFGYLLGMVAYTKAEKVENMYKKK